MKTAGVSDLKIQLSRYLSRVKAGEEIVVTERGRPIARLSPLGAAAPELESLRDLERGGLIRLGSGRLPKSFWKLARARDPEASLREAVAEERETGW